MAREAPQTYTNKPHGVSTSQWQLREFTVTNLCMRKGLARRAKVFPNLFGLFSG
jgi:hypothetical protein